MIKFIPQNKNDYEKLAKDELGINTSFLDFFSSESKEISDKINSTLEEIKSSKKRDIFYNKLLYYFSFLVNSASFKNDDKGKKVIQNMIEICEQEFGVKIYQDLFYILSDENNHLSIKKEILVQIKKSNFKFEDNDFILLYNIFATYLQEANSDNEIISIFAEIIEKNKNYILLKKLDSFEKVREIIKTELLNNKDLINRDINTDKLYFFLVMTSPNLVDEDISLIKLNEKLVEEKKMMDNLENRKDAYILYDTENQKYFEDTYGEKAAELILIGAKESSIHEIFIGFDDDKQTKISFKDFIEKIYEEDDDEEEKKIEFKDEEIKSKFEEIEDMIIAGKNHKLYNIVIDYLNKEIRILYLRRPEYTKEKKEELLQKVKDMKTKLEGILKAIEKI